MPGLETLKDKVVVVTGAARGWGLADAIALAKDGAKVVLADRTEKPRPDLMMDDSIYTAAEKVKPDLPDRFDSLLPVSLPYH